VADVEAAIRLVEGLAEVFDPMLLSTPDKTTTPTRAPPHTIGPVLPPVFGFGGGNVPVVAWSGCNRPPHERQNRDPPGFEVLQLLQRMVCMRESIAPIPRCTKGFHSDGQSKTLGRFSVFRSIEHSFHLHGGPFVAACRADTADRDETAY
jgi:hypothetical protein